MVRAYACLHWHSHHSGRANVRVRLRRVTCTHTGGGSRTCLPRLRCQNWQSAAPPAIVPSRKGLISITFFTVWDAEPHTRTMIQQRRSARNLSRSEIACRNVRYRASLAQWQWKQPA